MDNVAGKRWTVNELYNSKICNYDIRNDTDISDGLLIAACYFGPISHGVCAQNWRTHKYNNKVLALEFTICKWEQHW